MGTAGRAPVPGAVDRPRKRRYTKRDAPSRDYERALWAEGHEVVVGIDEVGRGAWAGPLAIGAAVVPKDRRITGVRDSKMLSEPERERIFDRIAGFCEAWSVGMASAAECDRMGMSAAQRLAAQRALQGLGLARIDAVLVDGSWDFVGHPVTKRLIKGDARCLSIAAASVLAKVTRDRLMREESEHFPAYCFDDNKGYPCPRHQQALRAYGPSTIHRRSWVFMDGLPWGIPRTQPDFSLGKVGPDQLNLFAGR